MEDSVKQPLSEPLKDIINMVEERPNLTQAEWEITEKVIPYLKSQLRPEVRQELEVEYTKKLAAEMETITALNKEHIEKQFEALKKSQEPLGKDDLQKLLSQEYIDFSVIIRVPSKTDKAAKEKRTFTVCELPSSIEEKFYKLLREALIPLLKEQESTNFQLENQSLISKIETVLKMSDKAFSLGAGLVAICLDPWKDDEDITEEWVKRHISIERQAAIILAQFEANKYRNFFSLGFQSFLNQRA
jgi:hypothetical protein